MYAPPLYKCTLDMVTDICMNFLKSSVVLIRCGQIDLDEVLEGILVTRDSLPLQYLGLPLSVWSLRRRGFQHLEDKCAEKLPTCNGKFIAMVGRVSLVKLVIATQAIYHLTPLSIPSRTLKYINKSERAFIWAAKDTTTCAKCKVHWDIVCRRKIYGGLGILHLKKIASSHRLRCHGLNGKIP
jgi:hypothetical protein